MISRWSVGMHRRVLSILCSLLLLLLARHAEAAVSGSVSGTFRFHQNQGNYCPSIRNCTGAKYFQSQYNVPRPVKNVKVYVERASDHAVIGQGTTDSNGQFAVSWYDPIANGSVNAELTWQAIQKDGRFAVTNAEGTANWRFWSPIVLSAGQTAAGTPTWGNSASPNGLANIYDGAHMTWANSLSQSNRMLSYFNGIKIRTFYSGPDCSDACASNGSYVLMGPNGTYEPQSAVMHELGHIASSRASRDQQLTDGFGDTYTYGGSAGWNYNTSEFASVAFEEAVASHVADVALYFPSATQPHVCISSGACPTNSFNLETAASCGTFQINRQPLSAQRYLWDNYDSVVDPGAPTENLSRGIWEAMDTVHAFDNGTGNRQKHEIFNAAMNATDDADGRSPYDFYELWTLWGTNSYNQFYINCLDGVGD